MYCNSSAKWHGRRHGSNWWVLPLVIIGLIILTHGWIIILPLMLLAGFAFFAFALPKIMWYVRTHEGEWSGRDWSEWQDKRKRHFEQWRNQWGNSWDDRRYDDKPKHSNPDHIDYV